MGRVDLHSHLIPGVDDGVKTLEQSLAAIEGLVERGYDRILTTPHQVDRWRPTPDELLPWLHRIQEETAKRGWPVAVGLGAENFLDEEFLRRSRCGELITYAMAGRAVLFECSPFSPPPFLESLVFSLRAGGITPVMAHPERYPWLLGGRDRVAPLRNAGCLFQIDVGSFAGRYGRDARRAARKLVSMDAVDLIASDLHHPDKLRPTVDDGWKALQDLASEDDVIRWSVTTPGRIFEEAVEGPWGPRAVTPPPEVS